jgi:hypothetical protein
MAVNFRITIDQNSDTLHLRLGGDFDGSSACQLLEALKTWRRFASRVFIHTNGLTRIYPFGVLTFQNNLDALRDNRCIHLEFTGDHASELAPATGEAH